MRIAILGTRGIPANYGGFETFAEQLSTRLVNRGHEVTVYGRKHYASGHERSYQGVNLVVLPTIRHKYFDTVIHTFLSILHATFFRRYDVILICNAANSIFAFLPRLLATPTRWAMHKIRWTACFWKPFRPAASAVKPRAPRTARLSVAG